MRKYIIILLLSCLSAGTVFGQENIQRFREIISPLSPSKSFTTNPSDLDPLIGYWFFSYTIIDPFFNDYLLYVVLQDQDSGEYFVGGEDEYGNAVVASFDTDLNKYSIFDPTYGFDKLYVFDISGNTASGLYYLAYPDHISDGYLCTGYRVDIETSDSTTTTTIAATTTIPYGTTTTTIPEDTNNPPFIPLNPYPADMATGVSATVLLTWSSGDPDPGDTVTYDLYLGTDTLPLFGEGIEQSAIELILAENTTYRWKVAAIDSHGAVSLSDFWTFTTGTASPEPPPTTTTIPTTTTTIAEPPPIMLSSLVETLWRKNNTNEYMTFDTYHMYTLSGDPDYDQWSRGIPYEQTAGGYKVRSPLALLPLGIFWKQHGVYGCGNGSCKMNVQGTTMFMFIPREKNEVWVLVETFWNF